MTFRGPPVTVIDKLRVTRHQLVFEVGHLPVERDGFNRAMGTQQDAAARGLVAPARLHPHIAVLNNIGATYTIGPTPLIQLRQHLRGRERFTVYRHDITALESQCQLLGLIRCRFWAHCPAPHIFLGWNPRVLQHITFIGNVQQIGVHGVRRLFLRLGKIDRDIVLLAIGHQRLAGIQIPLTPRCNHLNARFQRVGA